MQYLSKDFSIRDLAKECGVSVSTASKALNGYTDISPSTRELSYGQPTSMDIFPIIQPRI